MAKITKAEMPALAEQIVKCLGGKENVGPHQPLRHPPAREPGGHGKGGQGRPEEAARRHRH